METLHTIGRLVRRPDGTIYAVACTPEAAQKIAAACQSTGEDRVSYSDYKLLVQVEDAIERAELNQAAGAKPKASYPNPPAGHERYPAAHF